ncbi:DUF4942 domain-containing protein [Diaphorobacter sp. J5-51]|uniref:DUF4942 domain-containing protein n=1 Tax=Diaphorobacter sp. J5-51 TaxID=680496 RepID=UPI000A63640D|nr:DUF4942 domain-containing protein [Diaphorobacter sp. J5-51]
MDFQFYPTGAHTAARMWAKFKRPIGVVCDPSAGQGHLWMHAQNGFEGVPEEDLPWVVELPDEETQGRYSIRLRQRARFKFSNEGEHRRGRKGFLAVEIDAQHHAALRELGATVLGYDFMDIESLATVDQVIMNPPFADGAKHVLHAWSRVYDAEIVAIVNAETIRNPYSQERKRLVELIDLHGSVEYLHDQFTNNVDRKTDVEVALIYLEKKPEAMFDMDAILRGLKQGDNSRGPEIEPEMCNALALPENFVSNVYRYFVRAVDTARVAAEATAIAVQASNCLGLNLEAMQAKGVGNNAGRESISVRDTANARFQNAYRELKKQAWAQIIRSSLLTNKLSNQARRKVEAEAEAIYQLEFSVANVHGFLSGLFASMGDIYADMVCGLFDNIVGRSNDNVAFYKTWKSNERHRFGMRLKRTRFIIPNFSVTWGGSLCYESEQFLADIDKVFGYLHGVSESYDGLVQAFNRARSDQGDRISTRYFDFRFYKGAGTMHFYPKSQEVIEKLNRFVGARRQWLPDQMDQANGDFNKQYDEAETLTKKYDDAWKKSASRRGYISRVYAATNEMQTDEHRETCKSMANCIDKVHEDLGLHCGPALTAAAPVKALEMAKEEAPKPQPKSYNEPEQLDLLAA